jgi:hypothetical protein
MRLDNTPGFGADGYAIIEIPQPSLEIVSNAGAPKSDGFWGGGQDRLVNEAHPYTGNGFVASTEGKLRPEYHLGKSGVDGTGANTMVDIPIGSLLKRYDANGSSLGIWRFDGVQTDGSPLWVLE